MTNTLREEAEKIARQYVASDYRPDLTAAIVALVTARERYFDTLAVTEEGGDHAGPGSNKSPPASVSEPERATLTGESVGGIDVPSAASEIIPVTSGPTGTTSLSESGTSPGLTPVSREEKMRAALTANQEGGDRHSHRNDPGTDKSPPAPARSPGRATDAEAIAWTLIHQIALKADAERHNQGMIGYVKDFGQPLIAEALRLAAVPPVPMPGMETTAEERTAWRDIATGSCGAITRAPETIAPDSTVRILDDLDRALAEIARLTSALAELRLWHQAQMEDSARAARTWVEAEAIARETRAREEMREQAAHFSKTRLPLKPEEPSNG